MGTYQSPGVYREVASPAPKVGMQTGVPVFLGYTETGLVPVDTPQLLTSWAQFEERFGGPLENGYLAYSVNGFFENCSRSCYVVRLDDNAPEEQALADGLGALASMDDIDLLCAPDIMRLRMPGNLRPDPDQVERMQQAVLSHCDKMGDRFAILDSRPGNQPEDARKQRLGDTGDSSDPSGGLNGLESANGALYYPWVRVSGGPPSTGGSVPPCGHVAAVYARTDQRFGVHKAPANEVLEGVLDLEVSLTTAQQSDLNPVGVNCLRSFPGRGIRIWGARTLSSIEAWTYINVRRLFLTAGRWIAHNMAGVVFEPHDFRLWVRIVRDLSAYFNDLFRRGALKGHTAAEAFYVKCDGDTNPPEVRDAGMVVTEIGLAPVVPNEFVVVRITHGPSGLSLDEPTQLGQPNLEQ